MNLIVLAIIGLITVSISAEEQVALENINVCQEYDGFIQDQNNCKCFYQCDNEYRLWHMCCPDGQIFDEKSKACILGREEVCENRQSLVAVQQNPPSSECYSPNALFRHENCAKFWHCSYRRLYEMTCPDGTLWNDMLKICVMAQYSTCNTFDLNPIQNIVIRIPNVVPNDQMPKPQNELINNERARSGGIDEHISQTLRNNKWLSSVTYLTLDPNGKIIYGITKISKFSLDRVNEDENENDSKVGSTDEQTDEDSRESDESETDSKQSDDSEENSTQTSEDSTNTTQSSNQTISDDTSETTTEGVHEENEKTTETVATDKETQNDNDLTTSKSEIVTNDTTSLESSSLEDSEESTTQSTEDIEKTTPDEEESHTSSSVDSDRTFTDRPETETSSVSELVEGSETETPANTEESVTDTSNVSTTESTNESTTESTTDTTLNSNEVSETSTEPETTETPLQSATESDKSITETNTNSANDGTESIDSSTETQTEVTEYSTVDSNDNSAQSEVTTESDTTKTDGSSSSTEYPEDTEESVAPTNETPNDKINSSESTTEPSEVNETPKIVDESEYEDSDATEEKLARVPTESNILLESTTISIETTNSSTQPKDSTEQTESSTESVTSESSSPIKEELIPTESSTESVTSESSSPITEELIPTDNKTEEATLKPETGFELPTADRSICKEVGGYYADEKDCKCFYVCDLAYRPYRHCCPDGLLFNENEESEELVCDYPDSVTCRDGSNTPLRLKRSIHYKHKVKKVYLTHLKFT